MLPYSNPDRERERERDDVMHKKCKYSWQGGSGEWERAADRKALRFLVALQVRVSHHWWHQWPEQYFLAQRKTAYQCSLQRTAKQHYRWLRGWGILPTYASDWFGALPTLQGRGNVNLLGCNDIISSKMAVFCLYTQKTSITEIFLSLLYVAYKKGQIYWSRMLLGSSDNVLVHVNTTANGPILRATTSWSGFWWWFRSLLPN